uniref:Thioredoxin domain-containing protein n=1 Tax=Heterosigma akashiwo TaxID=2829 RepID=A0A7S3XUC0_HETAK
MPLCCLGPICIPWTAIWPLLLFLWRPIRTTFLKYFNPELLEKEKRAVQEKKANAAPAFNPTKAQSCCTQQQCGSKEEEEEDPVVIEITTMDDWEATLAKTGALGRTLFVDFNGTWCKPCKRIRPHFDALSLKYPADKFVSINVDELSDLAADVGVISLPTFVAFKAGEPVGRFSGATETKLTALVEEHNSS